MPRHISQLQRIHVMDNDVSIDFVTLNPEIATYVSCDYKLADLTPLTGRVELLVQPSLMTEGCDTDFRVLTQIAIAFLECRNLYEL
jgi:hypothetical protein